MPSRRAILHSAALLAALSSTAMLGLATPVRAAGEVKVVASFSILTDLIREVGGDRVAVTTLVPVNGDTHVYQPTPADSKAIAAARLVVFNGLGLEGWSTRLVKAAAYKGPVLVASDGIKPRKADADDDGHDAGHAHGAFDPHAWQDVRNVKLYVANIAAALGRVDPDGKVAYEARATAYQAKLDALDAEIRAAYDAIPVRQRRVITTHDAFGYYGAAYGITFLAPQGTSTDTEASAKDVARLIRLIRKEKIGAIFVENISDPRLIQRIADETGAKVGGALFSDALSAPDGPAANYLAMMRHNLALLAAAMRGTS
jgi:zinc/manganese transport system substrate-binding protein